MTRGRFTVFTSREQECISKRKEHKRYEFGCKVSVASTSRGGWFVGAMALHGNPYDSHTLKDALFPVERMAGDPTHASVDKDTGVTYTREPSRFMWIRGVEAQRHGAYSVGESVVRPLSRGSVI